MCQVHPAWIWTSHSVCVCEVLGCSSSIPPPPPSSVPPIDEDSRGLSLATLCRGSFAPMGSWGAGGGGRVNRSGRGQPASKHHGIGSSYRHWKKKRDDRRRSAGDRAFQLVAMVVLVRWPSFPSTWERELPFSLGKSRCRSLANRGWLQREEAPCSQPPIHPPSPFAGCLRLLTAAFHAAGERCWQQPPQERCCSWLHGPCLTEANQENHDQLEP